MVLIYTDVGSKWLRIRHGAGVVHDPDHVRAHAGVQSPGVAVNRHDPDHDHHDQNHDRVRSHGQNHQNHATIRIRVNHDRGAEVNHRMLKDHDPDP